MWFDFRNEIVYFVERVVRLFKRKKNINCKFFLFLGLMCSLFGSKGSMNEILILRILICFFFIVRVNRDFGRLFIVFFFFRKVFIYLNFFDR